MCKYYFKSDTRLSNYYMCNVKIDNLTFSLSEAAYHAEKFKQNSECLKELLDTEDMELIEDTTCWHDNIWGEYTCEECKNKEHKNYYYIRKCDMKLTSKKALDLLNENIGKTSSDKWIKHSKNVGYVAGVIAGNINLDSDFATTLGYIHDIGKKYGLNSNDGVIPHAINGYNYIKSLGYDEEYASICIKHSFLNNDINCLANNRDYTDSSNQYYNFMKEYIKKEYTIYEKIINLCDLMCTDKIYTVDKRIMDLLLRHGVYKNTYYHIKEVYKLKEYFDNLLGYNLYDLFPEIKENL